MQRKKIVAGNWKMNTDLNEAIVLVNSIKQQATKYKDVEKVIFPPYLFLTELSEILDGEANFATGAQNCSEHSKGAFTGEVSANMIASVGCAYVLVGHSERRTYFNESNNQLIAKINQALENNLKVVFCFGEQLAERKSNLHFETVKQQLEEVLQHFPKEKLNDLVLAYEPVWAIGTGETATPQQAQEMHAYVRKVLSGIFGAEVANQLSVLYGGSCNAQNAKELFACPDVDGGLIGGASLKADDFCKIIDSF
ncbi:MAG: triose-phosphate isomerase [Bacteroidia bacterium]|nr:triose-phosphate isomerase [Bacteroidia bacterium]